jgi:hypothetical protein
MRAVRLITLCIDTRELNLGFLDVPRLIQVPCVRKMDYQILEPCYHLWGYHHKDVP